MLSNIASKVIESDLDSTQLEQLKFQLQEIINEEKDSLRFYTLGNNYKLKVEHMGSKVMFSLEDTLII